MEPVMPTSSMFALAAWIILQLLSEQSQSHVLSVGVDSDEET